MKYLKLIISLFFLMSCSFGENSLARLIEKEGNVNIRVAGDLSFSAIPEMNSLINSGDALRTGENGYAQILFGDDESTVKIFNDSEISIHENYSSRRLSLQKGDVHVNINSNLSKSYSLETPNAIASIENVEFEAKVGKEESFRNISGNLEVTNLITGKKKVIPTESKFSSVTLSPEPIVANSQTNFPSGNLLALAAPPEEDEEEELPQDNTNDDKQNNGNGKKYNMGLGIGSVTIDGQIYNQIAFRPELRFGKLGVGLDLYFYFDENGNIRKDDWDEVSDYLDKIYYLRWGKQGDPFFARAGALNYVTLGYGILMNGYSNSIEYPQVRNIGAHLGMRYDKLGWEILVSDIKEISGPGLVAGRITYDMLWKLRFGGTFVADFNQYKGLVDTDEDNIPDLFDGFPDKKFSLPDYYPDGAFGISQNDKLDGKNYNIDSDGDGIPDDIDYDIDGDGKTDNYDIDSNKNFDNEIDRKPLPFDIEDQAKAISAVSFDAAIPVVEGDVFKLDLYGQSAFFISEKLTDYYSGDKFSPGWGAAVPGFRVSFFDLVHCNLEYRFSGENFLFSFWDRLYDMERVSIRQSINDPNQLWAYTKDELKLHNEPMKGVFGSVDFNIMDFLIFSTYYQHMTSGDDEIKSFRSSLSIPSGKIPKLAEAMVFYQRNNDDNPFEFNNPSENTMLGYRVGLDIGGGAILSYVFRRTYRDIDGNGKIDTDTEAISINTIETGFRF